MAKKLFPALLIAIIFTACAKPSDLEFVEIRNVEVLNWGLSTSDIGIGLAFYNPNKQVYQLKEADIGVYINEAYLGRATLDSVFRVPSRDTFLLPVIMQVSTGTAFTSLLSSIQKNDIIIRLDGSTKLGKSGVFIKYPVNYTGSWKTDLRK